MCEIFLPKFDLDLQLIQYCSPERPFLKLPWQLALALGCISGTMGRNLDMKGKSNMNHQFPTVKTYSTKWQRSYRLCQDKEQFFDTVTSSTIVEGKSVKDSKRETHSGEHPEKQRSRLGSREFGRTQTTQKSPKRITRPVTVATIPNRDSVSPRAMMTTPISRPGTVGNKRLPSATTGSPMITKPLRRYGVPTLLKSEMRRPTSSVTASSSTDFPHSQPKTLCTETLLKYRPEHAEKAYCKNDSYIHAWLRGVEEATAKTRRFSYNHDSESSIELLRETQTSHPAIARKNSASELLKDMMKAFKSSSMEQSSELSNIREQPSLPEQPSSATAKQPLKAKGKQLKSPSCPQSVKKSRIPCLSKMSKTTKTLTSEESACHASTPTVTRTEKSSNNTYTYIWTMGSSTSQAVAHDNGSKMETDSPTIYIAKLNHKKLNSTTRPKAKSLGKVDFPQCLSPILNEKMQKSAESTPDNHRKRSLHNKENIVPRKQRCVGSQKKGHLAPKASTVLFTSQTINSATTPDLSSIRLDKDQNLRLAKPVNITPKKPFDFDAVEKLPDDAEKESNEKTPCAVNEENKDTYPILGPVITSTPDSQHKYIRPELMILADLSSVAPPSAADDDLIPLRTSGFEVNSEEILCASDLDLEVDTPHIQDVASPKPEDNEERVYKITGVDSTYTVTPTGSTSTVKTKTVTNTKKSPKPLKRCANTKLRQGNKKDSPKSSLHTQTSNKSSPSKPTERGNKGPTEINSKIFARASTSQCTSKQTPDSCQEDGLPRWKYFFRASSDIMVSNSSELNVLKNVYSGQNRQSSGMPPCSLVALQRIVPSRKSTIYFKVKTKTTKLMSHLKEAAPDDIMTTARKLSKIKSKVES